MTQILDTLVAVFVSVMASNGLWAFINSRSENKSHIAQMLVGIGHDRITCLGTHYLERGDWITEDEYANLVDHLYVPYAKLGGNGTAEKIVKEVNERLRIVKTPPKE